MGVRVNRRCTPGHTAGAQMASVSPGEVLGKLGRLLSLSLLTRKPGAGQ